MIPEVRHLGTATVITFRIWATAVEGGTDWLSLEEGQSGKGFNVARLGSDALQKAQNQPLSLFRGEEPFFVVRPLVRLVVLHQKLLQAAPLVLPQDLGKMVFFSSFEQSGTGQVSNRGKNSVRGVIHRERCGEVEGAALSGSMMSDVHRKSGRLSQLGQQPQEHRILGTGRENNNNVAVRRRDPLEPEPLGGEEVSGARYLLLQ